jgi:hypothetical protein
MKQITYLTLAVLLAPVLAAIALASTSQPSAAAEPTERDTITILGKTYSIVPCEELRALGLELPDVAPEENAATYYLKAMEAYEEPARRSELGRLRDQVVDGRWTDESGPLAQYLEGNEEAFRLIEEAAAREQCCFPALLPPGASLGNSIVGNSLPHLMHMRALARLAVTEGKAREYEHRYEDILDAYLLALCIGNHTAQEPFLMSGLVGTACNTVGSKAIEQCLVRCELDEKTLAKAQLRVHELSKQRPSVVTALRGERLWSMGVVESLIKHPESAGGLIEGGGLPRSAWSFMLRSEEGQEQMRRDVRTFWDKTDKALELPLPEFIESGVGEELIRKTKARKFPPNIMSLIALALPGVRVSYGRNELYWTVLDVEFALARYKAQHGMYPGTLDELRPLMLSDGIDPFSGKPLHYRLEPDGSFTIWSVGEDLTDDGGKVAEGGNRWKAADYVWNSALIAGAD